jgi:hypothetical protein
LASTRSSALAEISQKYFTDEKALAYIAENNPDLSKIEVLEDRTEGGKRIVEFKYTTEVSLPGPIKKVMGGSASQSLCTKFIMDTENHTGTMQMIPSQMSDKISVSGKLSSAKEGDSWVQRMDGEATVKIFGVGKMIEKFLVEKIQTSSAVETRLRNAYIRSLGDKV